MVMITLYVRQQKRHRCIEQSFGLCGRGRGWDDLGEWHWNMYNIICEINRHSRFDAWYRMLGAGALGWPRGMVWGRRWERSSGWGTCVHPWWIHVAKSLQSCPTLCDPIDGSPPDSLVPGILQARTLEWAAISFSNVWKWKVKVKSLSRVRLLATPWTAAYQAPPSMRFSRQEYWSGVLLPSPSIQYSNAYIWNLERW